MEYLQFHLCANSLILFKIINKLFTKFEEVYKDFHCKKHAMKKLKELKIGMDSFNAFHSKFIKLAVKLKFTKEMLL